jgi:hypothetical protein
MLLGLASISHKKKAKFWRGLVALFPQLIDYMCAEDDLKQVRPASRLRPFAIDLQYARACARMNVRGPVRVCSRARVCVEGQCVRACAPTSLLLHVCGDI